MSDSFATLWTIARQAPLSMGVPRQDYWCGLPFPSSGASSQPGDRTWVSCFSKWILHHWETREAKMPFRFGERHLQFRSMNLQAVQTRKQNRRLGSQENMGRWVALQEWKSLFVAIGQESLLNFLTLVFFQTLRRTLISREYQLK